MSKYILHITLAVFVFFSGEPRKALLIDIDSQWINRCDRDIDPQIELQTFYQKRVRNVLRDNEALLGRHII